MTKRVALLIDGGHLRVLVRKKALRDYDPAYIRKVAHACLLPEEGLFRAFYYDCAPYLGTAKLPVSRTPYQFTGSSAWLSELAGMDLFAVCLGILNFGVSFSRGRPRPGNRCRTAISNPISSRKGSICGSASISRQSPRSAESIASS